MPTLSVRLNGNLLAQVRTDGYDVMSVRVHGTRVDDEFAELEMSGGEYPEQGESTFLTWINSVPLSPNDIVEVQLAEAGDTSHPGKTIDELFPDDNAVPAESDFNPTAEMFTELRAKTNIRSGYGFALKTDHGTSYVGRTDEAEHGFGFSLIWNSHRPGRASLSLHSYTIDSIELKKPMRDHMREYIEPPHLVQLRIGA